jgi:type I restriction enzyme S subunit
LFNWRNGSADHVGKTAYFDADGEYTNVSFLLRIRFDQQKHDSRYYHMFLNNLRNTEFFSSSKSRVNKSYNQTELGNLIVVVPPFIEQKRIAEQLRVELVGIDALTAKVESAVERLREYRSALISSAVTGKIKV